MIIAGLLNLFNQFHTMVCVIPEVSQAFYATKDMLVLQF
jgi:hypothetical protein